MEDGRLARQAMRSARRAGRPSSISSRDGGALFRNNKMKQPSRTPPTYIALLRGINLGGHKIVKMDRLRKTFEELGFADVKTYIQSGNVVFKAPAQTPAKLAKRIEEKILGQFGFPVPVVVKTAVEIGEVISSNPLLKEKGIDPTRLHVTFLSCAPDKSALKLLDAAWLGSRSVSLLRAGSLSPLPEWVPRDQARQ